MTGADASPAIVRLAAQCLSRKSGTDDELRACLIPLANVLAALERDGLNPETVLSRCGSSLTFGILVAIRERRVSTTRGEPGGPLLPRRAPADLVDEHPSEWPNG